MNFDLTDTILEFEKDVITKEIPNPFPKPGIGVECYFHGGGRQAVDRTREGHPICHECATFGVMEALKLEGY